MSTFPGGVGRVGPFELGRPIASSATGVMWQAYDPAFGRVVAAKQISEQAVRSVEGLRQTTRLLAASPHPNIVRVIGLIESPGQLWLVTEWIDGVVLPSMIESVGRLAAEQAVGVARGTLLGLAAAHENGVVHGDVSPSNVLVDRDGAITLTDFGLAPPTGTPGVSGTPGYLSPEAAYGMPLLPASDVYSAAALLAYLLRGRPPFEGLAVEPVMAEQITTVQPDLRGIDGALGDVLHWGLAPDASVRPADAGTFLAALDDAASRSLGSGWSAAAGLAGALAATMTAATVTATLAPAAGPAVTGMPVAAPTGALPALPGVAEPAPIGPGANPDGLAGSGAAKAGASKSGHALLFAVKSHALMAAAAVAAVCAVVAGLLVVNQHKSTPIAASTTPIAASTTPSISPRPTATPIVFDLAGFDWRNASVPGDSCYDPNEIALHDGQAALIDSSTAGVATHLTLRLIGAPAVGMLASGPQVAVLGLTCAWRGYYGGVGTGVVSYAVYDAEHGVPHLLGLFRDPGVWTGKHGVAVRNGGIDVTYSEYGPSDPLCCPSGPAKTATISSRAGALVASWPHSGPFAKPGNQGPVATQVNPPAPAAPSTTTSRSSASSRSASGTGFPRTVRLRTWSESRGGPTGTIPATLDARDRITDCARHSYGVAMVDYFRRHPCRSASRRLYTIRYRGRPVALSWITVDPGGATTQDGVDNAGTFSRLETAPNTGSIDDLLREGARPAGWPARIPPDETFTVGGHGGLDDRVEVFDAWYLDGTNTSQDPSLLTLIRSLYFTS
jgi:hypothetical protein